MLARGDKCTMPTATHVAPELTTEEHAPSHTGDAAYQLLGLLIVALVPAVFWTGLVAMIGAAFGQMPSALTLATIGAAIATFLFGAASTLFARARALS